MKRRGITHHNTGKIVLTGSEADVGPDITVEIEEQFLIQEIWDSIGQSRPHGLWYSSGYRQADFYVDQDAGPAVTLWINASDASFLDGQSKTRFRCPKLHALVMELLQQEHDRRQNAGDPVATTVYQKWRQGNSYYALVEIIDAHLANRPAHNRATKQEVLKHLGPPNWKTVNQNPEKEWAYQGVGRHVPYGDKVIFRFNEEGELVDLVWVSE